MVLGRVHLTQLSQSIGRCILYVLYQESILSLMKTLISCVVFLPLLCHRNLSHYWLQISPSCSLLCVCRKHSNCFDPDMVDRHYHLDRKVLSLFRTHLTSLFRSTFRFLSMPNLILHIL